MVSLGITGVPGVGKTTVARLISIELGLPLLELGEFAKQFKVDEYKDSAVVDMYRLEHELCDNVLPNQKDIIIESHLLCNLSLPLDAVFVLRLHPDELKKRLMSRGWDPDKVSVNVEAELLDYCLINAEENYDNVFQIDTTGKSPKQVVDQIINVLNRRGKPDDVDWSNILFNTL